MEPKGRNMFWQLKSYMSIGGKLMEKFLKENRDHTDFELSTNDSGEGWEPLIMIQWNFKMGLYISTMGRNCRGFGYGQ